MPHIKTLPTQLVNQIAAGEVIERPASVVKELLENSLDAGSTYITIDIEAGGSRLIRIRDNGCGIRKEELPLSVSSHATSKISALEDLDAIASLGFRGEALASIASVSQCKLSSRYEQAENAYQINATSNEITPSAHPVGTTVEVSNLFYNTPARRKFLRNDRTEFFHIEQVAKRIALSAWHCGFSLSHNKRTLFSVKPAIDEAQRLQRILKLYGKGFVDSALHLNFERTGLQLTGWIGLATLAKSNADWQSFFVNQRLVRDKTINHAVRQAYGDSLFTGRYPCYALYLTVDKNQVDVNVHPTKHEVRFRESRLVHDFIAKSISDALNQDQTQPPLPFTDASLVDSSASLSEPSVSYNDSPMSFASPGASPGRSSIGESTHYTLQETQTLYQELIAPVTETPTLGRFIGSLHNQFILVETKAALLVINLTKAIHAITRDTLLTEFKQKHCITKKPLLFPQVCHASEETITLIEKNHALLTQFGFSIDCISDNKIMLKQIPKAFKHIEVQPLITRLISVLKKANGELTALLTDIAECARWPKDEPLTEHHCQQILKALSSLDKSQLAALSNTLPLEQL